ncbi:MAG: hypothetical protein U0441_02260 [Polyangiaceae bacterium]
MRFVASSQVPDLCSDLAGRKFLVVGASAGPLAPHGLRRRIDDAVEGELAARGALPAAIGVDGELASCIRDQVFRTRALGTTGLAIALPPLSELTDADGRLNVDDSAALLAWTRATAALPVVLLASEADRQVSAYAPMPLERLLASEGRAAPPPTPPAVDEATWIEASREPPSDPFDMTPPPPPPAGQVVVQRLTPIPSAVGPRSRTTPAPPPVAMRAPVEEPAPVIALPAPAPLPTAPNANESTVRSAKLTLPDVRPDEAAPQKIKPGILKGTKRRTEPPPAEARAPHIDDVIAAREPETTHSRETVSLREAPRELAAREPNLREAVSVREARDHGARDARDLGAREHRDLGGREAQPSQNRETHHGFARDPIAMDPEIGMLPPNPTVKRVEEMETATVAARAREAARVVSAAEWRSQAMELDAARGPKPVRVIEQLFMTRYVPLVGALARGEADGAVRSVVDGWSQAFEHSYVDAFSAMRVTNKRPMMTFDAPEIATRIARLNGARGVKLLLVDSMSYDLGERVSAELRARSSANGVCVDRMLLWSALPTTTSMQTALLSRGPDALRDVEPPSEPEPEIARGRAIATLRRERLGTREVMKLDLVEARLRNAGPAYEERLDGIADEVAMVVARYLESLPARTLLFVFGDHGFKLPKSDGGRTTGPATQGGASPEEVLVPAYAWLAGGVH